MPDQKHSQNDEERFILSACAAIHGGRFLDIGAWNAVALSNTRALFERGWRGVLVEPSPNCVAGLAREYNGIDGIAVVAAACRPFADSGMYPMRVTDDALSTQDAASERKWREKGAFYGTIYIPSVTIPGLLNQFGAFDFVNIDTEGSSCELLFDLLRTEMMPKCICVEHDGRVIEAAQQAHARGYRQIYASGENLVFERE